MVNMSQYYILKRRWSKYWCRIIIVILLLSIIGLYCDLLFVATPDAPNTYSNTTLKVKDEPQVLENPHAPRLNYIPIHNNELSIQPQICTKYNPDSPSVETDHYTHIMYATDESYMIPMYVSINSMLQNTNYPWRLYFHILVEKESQISSVAYQMNQQFSQFLIKYEIKHFEDYWNHIYRKLTVAHHLESHQQSDHLSNPMNLARFYLPLIFDNFNFGLFLDPDTLFRGDIAELWDTYINSKTHQKIWAAHNAYCYIFCKSIEPLKRYLNIINKRCNDSIFDFSTLDKCQHPKKYKRGEQKCFNAGVVLFDLDFWRENEMTSKSEYLWQIQDHFRHHSGNSSMELWSFFTQSIMNILYSFAMENREDYFGELDGLWNCCVSGSWAGCDYMTAHKSKIVHYTGAQKPWKHGALRQGKFLRQWELYRDNLTIALNNTK